MADYFQDMWAGPGHLRFFVQPMIAILLGIRDGRQDARLGRDPYLLGMVRGTRDRRASALEGLKNLSVPLVLGVALSIVFQFVIRGRVMLVSAIGYGVLFVALPYVAARGLTNRFSHPTSRREVHSP